jgi:hypothetical protein
MRNIICVALAFCIFTSGVRATSIVAVLTPTTIVLGADSKLIRGDRSETRTVCKIGVSPNVIWGESGILDIPIRSFSVDRIAAASVAIAGTLDTRIAAFEATIVPILIEILNALKVSNPPDWFVRNYENQAALEMVFIAFEDDVPHLHLKNFVAQSDQITGNVSVEVKKTDHSDGQSRIVLLGRHEAADSELSKNSAIWREFGLIGGVRHLIEIEITAVPEEVGAPIAIVEITKGGPRWISEGGCASH